MRRNFRLALTLTLVSYWAETSPIGLDTLKFDHLNTDLSGLSYNVEEEDLDNFSKLLDYVDVESTDKSASDKPTINVKTSGFKKKNTANKGLKGQHNFQDIKDFYNRAGVHNQGAFDDDETYALSEGISATAVGTKGAEDRKYKKGVKTRGFHKVHHQDEYKKEKEFYEDDETNGNIKKIGAKGLGLIVGGGAGFHKGHYHHDNNKGIFGKQGYAGNKSFDKEIKGYDDSQGFDAQFSSDGL